MKTIIGVLALLISFVASASAAAPPITLPNDSTTGTALYSLAKLTVNGTAITTATTDVAGAIGIVTGGSGKGGSASIQNSGVWPCNFDPTTVVVGDFVQISSTGAGNCHDAGSTCPSGAQVIGQVFSSTTSAGVHNVNLSANSVCQPYNSYDVWMENFSPSTSAVIFAGPCVRTLTFPANLVGTKASCGTNPSEGDAYLLKVAGSTVATLTLSTSCVLSLSTQVAFTCTAGQRPGLDAPGTVSGANIGITIPVTR